MYRPKPRPANKRAFGIIGYDEKERAHCFTGTGFDNGDIVLTFPTPDKAQERMRKILHNLPVRITRIVLADVR